MPWLAALVCCSPFRSGVARSYGKLLWAADLRNLRRRVHESGPESLFAARAFWGFISGKYPNDFLATSQRQELPAWHLVGGLDLLEERN